VLEARLVRPPVLLAGLALTAAALSQTAPGHACAVAYPRGEFARLAAERTVIVWDAAHRTEHLIRKPSFDGDARRIAFFVPTPVVPRVGKAPDDVFDRVAALLDLHHAKGGGERAQATAAASLPDVELLQTVRVDDFELDTLKATRADALVAWLHANGFGVQAAHEAWAQPYLAKGWVITAMRYVAPAVALPDGGAHAPRVDTPTVRLSFAVDAPFYPYREPPVDDEERAAFMARRGQLSMDRRPLYVWLVADQTLEAFQGEALSGPYLHASARVPAAQVAAALGPTREWGIDVGARPEWTVTYLTQFEERASDATDVTFRAAKVLATAAPAAALASTPAERGGHRKRVIGLIGILLAAVVAVFAYLELRPQRGAGPS